MTLAEETVVIDTQTHMQKYMKRFVLQRKLANMHGGVWSLDKVVYWPTILAWY